MKGEGKLVLKSKMKWVGLFGLLLSAFSLVTHFHLANYTEEDISKFQSSIMVFSWRPVFKNADFSTNSPSYKRLWGPIRHLEPVYPHANPRGHYAAPIVHTARYIFARVQGGFHEIRNSICDAVVVARLLNATLVIPEIQSTTRSKGISSEFKSFAYLYDEDQFMVALAKEVKVVKSLPKNLKGARRKKEIPIFKVPYSASPDFYLHQVLPKLRRHLVVELTISDGGCLQAILPPDLEEYQRLRCRVAFHALQFRKDVWKLAYSILNRIRAPRQPFIAYFPGMTTDALAYHGCAELFQDVHTELIQHKRAWMVKRGIVKGKLSVDSAGQRRNGSCPLMAEEVGILLRTYGYSWDTVIYVSGGEVFGGQRTLIPLRAMFENVVDRTSLTTNWELGRIYGHETNLLGSHHRFSTSAKGEMKMRAWRTSGPRPRPLPPPPVRPKYPYNIEGWWGWVAESDKEPETTVMELRTNAHKLLWEAIDYVISVEADVFIPGFDRDGKGRPNFASLVMGQRLYQSAAAKTYRPDRKVVVELFEEVRDHRYEANHTWIKSIRRHLRRSLIDGVSQAFTSSKPLSFLSHPVPECSCLRYDPLLESSRAPSPAHAQVQAALGIMDRCPSWMDGDSISQSRENKEQEENLDEDDLESSGFFFRRGIGSEVVGGELSNKEDAQMEEQEELEGGER